MRASLMRRLGVHPLMPWWEYQPHWLFKYDWVALRINPETYGYAGG
jgi:hypothetical protein